MYSRGGSGVRVGCSVGVDVIVGVSVSVGVSVEVISPCAVSGTGLFDRSAKNTTTAPNVIKSASKPKASGRLSVISGRRFELTFEVDLDSAFASNSLPHTRQRVAVSLNRVPQTGHILVFEVLVSVLIIILA